MRLAQCHRSMISDHVEVKDNSKRVLNDKSALLYHKYISFTMIMHNLA